MVVHNFNPNIKEGKASSFCEFKVRLVYRRSSRQHRETLSQRGVAKKET